MTEANTIQDRVFALVAEERGEKREKLSLTTTLGQDLGMDGDDAVEFFDEFRGEFALDLGDLYRDWNYYFGPEGIPITSWLLMIVPPTILGIGLIAVFPAWPSLLVFLILFGVWLGLLFSWGKKQGISSPQINIADLIEAANTGRWTKQISGETRGKVAYRVFYGGLREWFKR